MDDQQLVRQVLGGSDSAVRLLISRYERLVVHMVARVVLNDQDREELCQDVFVKVCSRLDTFNFDAKLSTWIATIAFRTAMNFAKKKKLDQVDLDLVSFKVGEGVDLAEEEDTRKFVRSLVEKLPAVYKGVLTLFYLDGFSYPEIVEITGMPEGTVKNYIYRARKKLKDIVEEASSTEIALL